MVRRILVVADLFGEQQIAFNKAKRLSEHNDAMIHVLVFCYDFYADLQLSYAGHQDASQVNLKDLIIERLRLYWQQIISQSPFPEKVTYQIVWTKYMTQWILEHCKNDHYDLVVKTGRRTEDLFYTPSDWQLFRQLNMPMYSVAQMETVDKPVVLVALDLLTHKKEKQALNIRLMKEALRLSLLMNAEIHCCTAVNISTILTDLDIVDSHEHFLKAKQQIKGETGRWLEQYNLTHRLHIKMGKPREVILSCAKQLDAQCIVVGSQGRKGISGRLMGNTAEKVVHVSDVDLVVV